MEEVLNFHRTIDVSPAVDVIECDSCHRNFLCEIAYLEHDFECFNYCTECGIEFSDCNCFKDHFVHENNNKNVGEIPEVFSYDEFIRDFTGKSKSGKPLCLICATELSSKSGLQKHLRSHHSEVRTIKCSFCDLKFFSNRGRFSHMKSKHPTKYKCDKCSFRSVKYDTLVVHSKCLHKHPTSQTKSPLEEPDIELRNIEFVKSRNDDIRSIKKEAPRTAAVHVMSLRGPEDSELPKFREEYAEHSENEMNAHQNDDASQPLKNLTVDISDTTPNSYEFYLKGSIVTDIENKSKKFCKICEVDLTIMRVLRHFKEHHKSKFHFICSLCDERFLCPSHRMQHMRDQHQLVNVCQHCNQQFIHDIVLSSHTTKCAATKIANEIEISQNPPKKIKLENLTNQICHVKPIKSLSDEIDLQMAQYKDNKSYLNFISCQENGFSCAICGFVASTRKVIICHLKNHDQVPSYSCSTCTEKFFFKLKLQEHLEGHAQDEIKPEIKSDDNTSVKTCITCDKSFDTISELIDHNLAWHSKSNSNRCFPMEFQKDLMLLRSTSGDDMFSEEYRFD